MTPLKLAVIGKDVSKSQSPEMHKFIAENSGRKVEYEKISILENEFENRIEKLIKELDGFNVTIPYKVAITPYLKVVGDGKAFGAVNTVKCSLKEGYNTDGLGFALMLELNKIVVKGNKFLLLGAGGAGRSVAKKLKDGGAEVFVYDNDFRRAQDIEGEFGVTALADLKKDNYYCVINATGVGMHKSEGKSPVDGEILKNCDVAVDLIYTPPKSKFLKIAEGLGKRILNGEGMLFYQAYFAECIFFGSEPDPAEAARLFKLYKEKGL